MVTSGSVVVTSENRFTLDVIKICMRIDISGGLHQPVDELLDIHVQQCPFVQVTTYMKVPRILRQFQLKIYTLMH